MSINLRLRRFQARIFHNSEDESMIPHRLLSHSSSRSMIHYYIAHLCNHGFAGRTRSSSDSCMVTPVDVDARPLRLEARMEVTCLAKESCAIGISPLSPSRLPYSCRDYLETDTETFTPQVPALHVSRTITFIVALRLQRIWGLNRIDYDNTHPWECDVTSIFKLARLYQTSTQGKYMMRPVTRKTNGNVSMEERTTRGRCCQNAAHTSAWSMKDNGQLGIEPSNCCAYRCPVNEMLSRASLAVVHQHCLLFTVH
ncbi:hypothetical protein K474DRAFT_1155654 [Panus rudis PR-1116 ss-1]|nr:hypothetical protein K474DRAFT_1155654 [Panus rudis PR-1116 ss-1]